MDYLLFRLYGPMASWGEIAVGENRHTAFRPSKSAILGLLGAALGIDRLDDEQQGQLATGYLMASKVVAGGQLLRDYHTTQAPDSVGKFQYRTRRDEIILGRKRLGTILSSREYRTDSLALVAITVNESANWSLRVLAEHLAKPRFHLYLGRKACPLAAPLNPKVISTQGFKAAFEEYQPGDLLIDRKSWDGDSRWLASDAIQQYYWEGLIEDFAAEDEVFDRRQVQQLSRYDQPLSRRRWQFQPRQEFMWQAHQQGGQE